MQRLLTLAAACLISGAMAFAQGTVTEQPPAGTQSNPNTVNATPNSNGTAPSNAQGRAARTPSAPNQTLPGKSNPANPATSDAGTNGQAVSPNGSATGTPGTASGNTPNTGDNSDNNGMAKDDTGNNAAKGKSNTITNPGTSGVNSWFWMALIIIVAIVLAAALLGRTRARANIDPADPALRATSDDNAIRDQKSRDRRDDQLRKAG
jgi:hypothetical protein